jgi:hypothetical protein
MHLLSSIIVLSYYPYALMTGMNPAADTISNRPARKLAFAFELTKLITFHNPHPNTSLPAETKSVSCTALPTPMEER